MVERPVEQTPKLFQALARRSWPLTHRSPLLLLGECLQLAEPGLSLYELSPSSLTQERILTFVFALLLVGGPLLRPVCLVIPDAQPSSRTSPL